MYLKVLRQYKSYSILSNPLSTKILSSPPRRNIIRLLRLIIGTLVNRINNPWIRTCKIARKIVFWKSSADQFSLQYCNKTALMKRSLRFFLKPSEISIKLFQWVTKSSAGFGFHPLAIIFNKYQILQVQQCYTRSNLQEVAVPNHLDSTNTKILGIFRPSDP